VIIDDTPLMKLIQNHTSPQYSQHLKLQGLFHLVRTSLSGTITLLNDNFCDTEMKYIHHLVNACSYMLVLNP
jgi:hypothetical protein